jgi:hypothetical protein
MFRKSYGNTASQMFKKGLSTSSNASKSFGRASTNINDVIKKGNEVIDSLEKIPFVKSAISMSPEAQEALAQTKKGFKVAGDFSNILKKTSESINPLNYEKITTKTGGINAGKVQKNINTGLQRAKDIEEEAKALYNFVK